MASPITWRNINSPSLRDSVSMNAQASNNILQGLGGIADIFRDRESDIKADEAKSKRDALNSALNNISSIGSVDEVRNALNNNLVGQLGLGDENALAARSALENRLSQLQSSQIANQQFDDSQIARGERDLVNQMQLAIANGNLNEARSIAGQLTSGGQYAGDITEAANRQEDRQFRLQQQRNEQALGDSLRNAIAQRNQNLENVTDPSQINPLSVDAAQFIADAPQGVTASQIGNLIRNVGAFDAIDGFNQLKDRADATNAYQAAVSNAVQSGQVREQLNSLPKVSNEQLSGAEIIGALERESKQPLITDWNWLPATQDRGQIAKGLQKAVEEVGDSQAVLEAFRNDPQVLEAMAEDGGLGSWADNIDFDKLTTRARGFKRKNDDLRTQRQSLAAELAKFGVAPPKF